MSVIFTRLNDTIRKTKFLCFLLLASSALQAQTKWYVNDNSTSGDIYTTAIGNDANAGTSASAPKLTLGAAFTAAAAGDIIYVDKGTFTDSGNRALTLNKAITIIGAGTGNTIFTSHSEHRFAAIAANNVSIQNLQLYDFFLIGASGQALLVNPNVTGFKLTNVVMKKNYGGSSNGESIFLSSGSSSTFDGLFFSCSGFNGQSGGAIKVNSCTLDVKNSAFSQSRDADGKGGAIEISGATSIVTVDNTSFDGNSARAGGAIAQNAGKLYVTNSCFNRNYIQGDSGTPTNGGGHYYAKSTDANLIASFTNCKFQGAFFCATTNPTGYLCEASSSTSNDGAAFSLRGTTGTFSFDTCLFDNSNMPAKNFDNGLDFYIEPTGSLMLTINNSKFGNDLTNFSSTKGRNIYITGLNNTTQKVIVTNSGASTAANIDGVTGNNFSLSGTLTTGSNSALATSDATASCGTTIAGCTIAVNCATETIAPVITACAPNQTLSSCSGTLPDYRPLISAFDDCDFTITQSPAPGTSLSSLGNGNHTITFTVIDQSPNSPNTTCTMVLSLSGCYTCNPSLSYPNSGVCSASTAVTPTFSPAGGTFTSTSGLTIDATTGVITPSTSTAGTYTITYTPNASYPTCTTTSTFTITAAPAQPTIACYETATLNTATCTWEVTGTQPAQPTLACYETATFNTTTCAWDVTGTQPAQPTLACYESATFNTTTCSWDVTGTQPEQPTLACYETATFNTTTCSWDVTGTALTATATAGTILCNGGTTDVTVVANGGTAPYTITPSTTNLPAGPYLFTITDANGCETSASVVITEPDALIASITSSKGTNFCFGETNILTVSEGTSYLWNTGATTASISVTTSGTYSVTVTNANGCEANTSLIVNANYCNFACPTIGNLLQNGSFENPSKNGYYGFEQMPFWTNAADGNKVEIMGANLYCVGCWTPPANGIQFVELNANQRGNIHQDVTVLPNKSLELSFMHRARESAVGVEKLRVTLSDPTNNSNIYTFDVTAVFGVWKKITGNYVTGPNQTSVRVRLQTITSLYPGSGNYLDNVTLNYVDCGPNTATIIGSNYICEENDATLSVTNATDAVSYLWSNGATTSSITVDQPGSYYVKVTFANGTNIISAPFVVADFLTSAAINGTSSFCAGTTNTLTASGGSSYLWNTGATSASINVTTPGTYSVTISNSKGCSVVKQIVVTSYVCSYCPASNNLLINGSFENPALTSSWGIVSVPNWTNIVDGNKIEVHKNVLNIPVPNGSQYIEVNGSAYGKIYQDVTVLANKSLQLSFMYRGRSSSSESIKVTLLDPTNNTNIYSFNTTATLNVWKKITANYASAVNQTKIRVLIEGLTGQNAGLGNLIDNVNLNYYDCANNSSVVIGFNEICNGSSTILSLLNNNNIVSYLWSTGATTPTISVNQAGNYSVTVTYSDGTTLTSSGFNVTTCNVIVNRTNTSSEKPVSEVINYNVILYPNPTVSSFSLNIVSDSNDAIEVSVYDIQGRIIENKTFNKEDINSITIGDNLPSGIYNVVVKQDENVKSQRLIKK